MNRFFAIVKNIYWFDNSNKENYIVLEEFKIPHQQVRYMYSHSKHETYELALQAIRDERDNEEI